MTTSISVGNQSFLGYLPATIIQTLITSSFDMEKDLPKHYLVQSVALFADISGFTKLSEGFSKKGRIGPEFLQFCLNRYMEQIINIIGTNGGDIFKFVGDAIMVVWPPEPDNHSFLQEACRRAIQCALTIQSKLHNHKISNDKSLSVKIGIGVGECKILLVGGQFKRCEYLCVGDAMKQACDSEGMAECGGQTIISSKVKDLVEKYYTLIQAKENNEHPSGGNKFYIIDPTVQSEKLKTKSEAYLIRTRLSPEQINKHFDLLRLFVPHVVSFYLNIEKETWSKEIRMVSIMFLNLKVDLSQIQGEEAFDRVQKIASTVQRCIYRTHGVLNKFLMDDKGSVMLNVWGIPPFSSIDDPSRAVVTGISISKELAKIGYHCVIGITTGTCFSGVCGTLGNRREYSLLGEVVNLSARYMGKGKEKISKGEIESENNVLIDKNTKELIQNKIRCKYLFTSGLKGFSTDFDFYTPVEDDLFFPTQYDPFPLIRTHIVYEGSTKSQRVDRLKLLKRNMTIIGNEEEQKIFIKIMKKVIKNKSKKVFAIKGMMGTGKSLFIRSSLYDLISYDPVLSKIYLNISDINASDAQPTFILCSFQSPLTYNHPMNGVSGILRYIYLQIKKSCELVISPFVYSNIEYKCDLIGKMIIETENIPNIALIEEILSYETNNDIDISSHFDKETYNKYIKGNVSYGYFKKFTKKKIERDRFFEAINEKLDFSIVVKFSLHLLMQYKLLLSSFYASATPSIPLILVIEDAQAIDKISVDFLRECLNLNTESSLYPLIVIFSYQIPFVPHMQSKEDLISKDLSLMEDNELSSLLEDENENNIASFLMNNITDPQLVEELIIFYLEEKIHSEYNSTLKRVDKELIDLILKKSFGGIPLFIIDVVENLIDSKIYTQFLSEELDITSELRDMDELSDWSEFKIPIRMEKICGSLIDTFSAKEIIILKYASVIGTIFDSEKLIKLIPFNNVENDELYNILLSFEQKNIIEILYDLHPLHKRVVSIFSFPFIREILYQRMLIEQRNDIHFALCKLLQINKFRYLPEKIEVTFLEHHLETSEKTIMKQIQEDDIKEIQKYSNKPRSKLNLTNLKISIVKNICEKLSQLQNRISIMGQDPKSINNYALRRGALEKKSDGKITWENRFFVITKRQICYYYTEKDFLSGVMPLASFLLKDMIDIEKMGDFSIGNKINIFTVTVSKWKKKDIEKPTRKYIFSCKTKEELYDIIITLKFLKVQAIYESFATRFGDISFPLYKTGKEKKKKKKFYLEEKNSMSIEGSRIINKKGSIFFNLSTDTGKNGEEEKICCESFKKIMNLGLTNLLGLIQEGINGNKNYQFEVDPENIDIPYHLHHILNKNERDRDRKGEIFKEQPKIQESSMNKYPKNSATFEPFDFKNKTSTKKENEVLHTDNYYQVTKNETDNDNQLDKITEKCENDNKITIDTIVQNMMNNDNNIDKNQAGVKNEDEFSLQDKVFPRMGTFENEKNNTNLLQKSPKQNQMKISFGNPDFLNSSRKENGNAFTLQGKAETKENNQDLNLSYQNNSFHSEESEKIENSFKKLNTINCQEDTVVSKLKSLNLKIDNEEQYFLSIAQDNNFLSHSYTPNEKNRRHRNSKFLTTKTEIKYIDNGPFPFNVTFNQHSNSDLNYQLKFSKYRYVNKPGEMHNKTHISNFFDSIKK